MIYKDVYTVDSWLNEDYKMPFLTMSTSPPAQDQ